MKITCYEDFVDELMRCGFSSGGSDAEIFSLIPWSWQEEPPYETPVRWHTGDPRTDPWEWRMRVLDERRDIAYAKCFFRKSGYITRDWYPCFLAVRRKGKSYEEAFDGGEISREADRIYRLIREHGALPVHMLKDLSGLEKRKSAFDRALTELQMGLFITMCGRQQKLSRMGQEYGWSSTVFCTTEDFWGREVFEAAAALSPAEAVKRITARVFELNPQARPKRVAKFIEG